MCGRAIGVTSLHQCYGWLVGLLPAGVAPVVGVADAEAVGVADVVFVGVLVGDVLFVGVAGANRRRLLRLHEDGDRGACRHDGARGFGVWK